MAAGQDVLPTGYYRVRDGFHPSGAARWRVARWMPTCGTTIKLEHGRKDAPAWRMGDEIFPPGHWQEIGARVA